MLVVIGVLWIGVVVSDAVRLLAPVTALERYNLLVIYPRILLAVAPVILGCYALARSGYFGAAARVFVACSSAVGFLDIAASAGTGTLSTPIVALVICGLLLTPWDAIGCCIITAAGYLIIARFLPSLTAVELHGELIVVAAVGALCIAVVAIHQRDLRQIEAQAQELVRNQERLVEARKTDAVARLAAGVAHEFNNIMSAIGGYAQIIRFRSPGSAAPYAERIEEATRRATRLTDSLLSYSEQQFVQPQVTDLDELLRALEPRLSSTMGSGTRLELRLSSHRPSVVVDASHLQDALATLVRKAESDMTAGGAIVVESEPQVLTADNRLLLPPGPYVRVSISYGGPPNDLGALHSFFDPFFTTGEFGTGNLDLAAAFGVIRQSGGTIELTRDERRGNSIVVVLPLRSTQT